MKRYVLTCSILWLTAATPVEAQDKLPPLLRDVGFDQRLDEQVPLDLVFQDEAGRTARFGDTFGSKPVILVLVQYRCPMLCNLVLNGLADVLGKLAFDVGREFDVVTISFDPREKPDLAAAKKRAYIERYDRPAAEAGWHFLTGEPEAIERLTQAVGFRYAYDSERDRFAHPSGIVILTSKGRVARYFFGVEYSPRDVRLGLVEAAENKIGTRTDQVMLFCYGYDPATGKYSLTIIKLLRSAGLATVLAIGLFILGACYRERRKTPRRNKLNEYVGGKAP